MEREKISNTPNLLSICVRSSPFNRKQLPLKNFLLHLHLNSRHTASTLMEKVCSFSATTILTIKAAKLLPKANAKTLVLSKPHPSNISPPLLFSFPVYLIFSCLSPALLQISAFMSAFMSASSLLTVHLILVLSISCRHVSGVKKHSTTYKWQQRKACF